MPRIDPNLMAKIQDHCPNADVPKLAATIGLGANNPSAVLWSLARKAQSATAQSDGLTAEQRDSQYEAYRSAEIARGGLPVEWHTWNYLRRRYPNDEALINPTAHNPALGGGS